MLARRKHGNKLVVRYRIRRSGGDTVKKVDRR